MELRFKDKGVVEIDGVRIIWPNFAGKPNQYGNTNRTFNIVIPNDEAMQALIDAGWNVKVRQPLEEGGDVLRHLKVTVGVNGYRPPTIWVIAGGNRRKMQVEDLYQLDQISIDHVDLDITPYHSNGHQTAYLQSMVVVQRLDRFEARFADEEYPEE